MKSLAEQLGRLWCKMTHPAPMWPVHGHYLCPACLRSYPVPWEQKAVASPQPRRRAQPAHTLPAESFNRVTI